jgi:hypothetical protein
VELGIPPALVRLPAQRERLLHGFEAGCGLAGAQERVGQQREVVRHPELRSRLQKAVDRAAQTGERARVRAAERPRVGDEDGGPRAVVGRLEARRELERFFRLPGEGLPLRTQLLEQRQVRRGDRLAERLVELARPTQRERTRARRRCRAGPGTKSACDCQARAITS